MERVGIERRLHTSGEKKSLLDPFLPEKPEDVARLKDLQTQIHETFIEHVKSRRGDKLKSEDLFTGNFWLGSAAIELGLVDGIGYLVPKMKEMFGDKTKFVNYSVRAALFQILVPKWLTGHSNRCRRSRSGHGNGC